MYLCSIYVHHANDTVYVLIITRWSAAEASSWLVAAAICWVRSKSVCCHEVRFSRIAPSLLGHRKHCSVFQLASWFQNYDAVIVVVCDETWHNNKITCKHVFLLKNTFVLYLKFMFMVVRKCTALLLSRLLLVYLISFSVLTAVCDSRLSAFAVLFKLQSQLPTKVTVIVIKFL